MMTQVEKVGLVLLALMLVALVVVVGPQALGALAGAGICIAMVRVLAPRREP
jgi:hypothetical protein